MHTRFRVLDLGRRLLVVTIGCLVLLVLGAAPAAAGGTRICFFCAPPATTPTSVAAPTSPAPVVTLPPVEVSINISSEVLVIGAARDVIGAPEHMLALINAERARAGAAPLAMHEPARVVAASWARSMQAVRQISHNDAYFSAASKRATGATIVGENVAMDNRIDDAHDNLMSSSGHRANILNKAFNAVGIGVVTDGSGVYFIVQDFLHTSRIVTTQAPAVPVVRAPPVVRAVSTAPRVPGNTAPVAPVSPASTFPTWPMADWDVPNPGAQSTSRSPDGAMESVSSLGRSTTNSLR